MVLPICYDLLLSYSNSVCDLLIIKLIQPELIGILLYRPPSCSGPKFDNVILKMKSVMFKLVSPLPNIIMLGDLFFVHLLNHYFFNNLLIFLQGKIILFDLVLCNSELIDSIDICDTYISAHCLLTVNTCIPVYFTKYHIIVNPPSSIFVMLNFKGCNWLSLQSAIRDITGVLYFHLFS